MGTTTRIPKPKAATPKPEAKPKAARTTPQQALPFGALLQTKLALGPTNDMFERQADSAAAHVVANRPGTPSLSGVPISAGLAQRACSACEDEQKSKRIQRKCACGASQGEPCSCKHEEEHPELQIDRSSKGPEERSNDAVGAVQSVVSGPGKPLSKPVRQDMESGFGRSFSHVRIHDTPRAAASAEGIGAHAYTVGNHIAFNRGQYQPSTDSGRFLLAHELAHTVQQSGAPQSDSTRISQPGDRHETQANRAASAATSGTAVPGLTPGGAAISRYGWRDAVGDVAEVGTYAVGGVVGGMLFGDDVRDLAVDAAESVIDFGSEVYQTAVALAESLGVDVSIDGTTLVIDFEEFDPCPEIDFSLRLSDLGLDPTLYFPLGPPLPFFSVGVVTLAGMVGVELNLDPGIGFRLEDCSFGPGQIRINPLTASASIAGSMSVTTSSMMQIGADVGFRADMVGIIAWPDPPFIMMIPIAGLAVGGAMEFMLQNRGTLETDFAASASLGGVSGAVDLSADVGYGVDFSYGLYGAVSVLGHDLCRLGWPLDSYSDEIAAHLSLRAAASVGPGGLSFNFAASAKPLGTNPLDDLSFAFDETRMEDDCWLCEFLNDHQLLPSHAGYNWAGKVQDYPLLAGPEREIYQRDPGLKSRSLCRGTCGVNCSEGACDNNPHDLVVCENRGDSHVWHTYVNYDTCGTSQGCRDHDACYDMAPKSFWGFGGHFIGPMFRACDLDSVCAHGFQNSAQWAFGAGPQDADNLRYADYAFVTEGCLGRCPETIELEDGSKIQQTCLTDRELWSGVNTENTWEAEFFNDNLVTGTVPIPFIGVPLWYGVNADARAAANAFAELGPINLMNACLDYDPATKTYTGHADMTLFANVGASAAITATLDGFLSDPACFLNWITIRGSLSAGIAAQLPSQLTASVDLFCANGQLTVLPSMSFETCLNLSATLDAGLDFYLLSFNVWGKEWELAKQEIDYCWDMELDFDPFTVGQMPTFNLVSAVNILDGMLERIFPQGTGRDVRRPSVPNPLPGPPSLLFPCLRDTGGGDDDDGDDDGPSNANCDTPATDQHGQDLIPIARRTPHWTTKQMAIPGGGSATVGTGMEIEFLGSSLSGGSVPTVQGAIYGNPGIPKTGCFKVGGVKQSKSNEQQFVRGHLLNGETGGPGNEAKNLFPITASANSKHKTLVEQGGTEVVPKVRDRGLLLYYKVTVSGDHTPREITNPTTGVGRGFYEVRSTLLCEVAEYSYCDDNTLRRGPITRVPINQDFVFHPSGRKAFDTITEPGAC